MNKIIFIATVIVGIILSTTQYSYNSSSAPPNNNGYTGAPGESTCGSCHGGNNNPNNNGNFLRLNFNNNTSSYTPSQTYNVTISNLGTNGNNTRNGFRAVVLNSSNSSVGTFAEVQQSAANTGIVTIGTRSYIQHASATSLINSWSFQWTAPATNIGDVTFYVASITGNGSGSSGDILYVDTFIIRAQSVTPPHVADFTVNDNSICAGESVTFTNASTGSITSLSWNFGANATPATATGNGPHVVTYSSAGSKTVSLIADGAGGSDTETKTSFVTVNGLPVAEAGNNAAICRGATTNLLASGGNSYVWNNAATLSNANIANPVATPTITTTYTVTVTNANGCSATDNVTITVNDLPIADAGQDVTICNGGTTELVASGGTTYQWNNANTLTNATIATPFATPTATTTYSVTVTNANGCTASDNVTVNVSNSLSISITNDTTICEGDAIVLVAGGGNTFTWSPANGLSSIDIANPLASPTATTTYAVTVSDGVCTGNATVTVTVDDAIEATVSNDTFAVVSDVAFTIPLFASGGDTYSWTPATGLSNTTVANPVFNPLDFNNLPNNTDTTISYVVTITRGTCVFIDTVNIQLTISINAKNIEAKEMFNIYPNPAKNTLYIESIKSINEVTIINSIGKQVAYFNAPPSTLNIAALDKGLYILKIQTGDNETVWKKFIVE